MVFSGITANNAAQVFKDFAAALPTAKLYGPGRRRRHRLRQHRRTASRRRSPKRTKVTIATLSPDQYPPEGQEFFKSYTQKYGEANPRPVRDLRLRGDAARAGRHQALQTGEKADVVKALFATKDRKSVLGTYSIDANGDTSLTDYGVYSIKDGKLEFDKTIKAADGLSRTMRG